MDNFGTQAKPYQAARAAEAGLVAVRRALAGLDAGPDALDGAGGFLQVISPSGRVDRDSPAEDLGKDWYMARHGLNIKRYPVVGAAQRCVDAALQLQADHEFDCGTIERVTARISFRTTSYGRSSWNAPSPRERGRPRPRRAGCPLSPVSRRWRGSCLSAWSAWKN